MREILIYNKKTGSIEEEKVHGIAFIRLLYSDAYLSRIIGKYLLTFFAKNSLFSRLYGFLQTRAYTKKKIKPFIEKYSIDPSEFLEPIDSFHSFNDFFIRKLKPEKRPINQDERCVIAPCDGRFHVIENLSYETSFFLKGTKFNLQKLMQDETLEKAYQKGSMVLARLCPIDYHRFHFPISGRQYLMKTLPGFLYSVNPIAVAKYTQTFWENKRSLTLLQTALFGDILMIEVGATCVGSIHQTCNKLHVTKGEEKGYFSFGGSSLLLLFEPGKIKFDQELLTYSKQGYEVLVKLGDAIGYSLEQMGH